MTMEFSRSQSEQIFGAQMELQHAMTTTKMTDGLKLRQVQGWLLLPRVLIRIRRSLSTYNIATALLGGREDSLASTALCRIRFGADQ